MSKPFRDEAEIYTYINVAKSTILSLSTVVEHLIEVSIASHFSIIDKDYELFCKMFYPKRDGLPFGIKIGLFEKLIEQDEPKYLEKNTGFIKSIRKVKDLRNNFAHAMDKPKELAKYVGKHHFDLDYLEEGKMLTRQFNIDDIKNTYDEIQHIIDEINQFNIRDEVRKNEKIENIKMEKP